MSLAASSAAMAGTTPLDEREQDSLFSISTSSSDTPETHGLLEGHQSFKSSTESSSFDSSISRRIPSPRSCFALFRRTLWLLLPSFVQSRLHSDTSRPERVHPTAYLDGMRGLAAFAVFISHATYQTFEVNYGYGGGEPGENIYPIQLPIVRLLYHGPPMVAIFFVISGYALSYKPVQLMRSRAYDSLMSTISSSVFRRAMRLYLPCFASTFLIALLCQLGAFKATEAQYHAMRLDKPDHHAWTAPNPYLQFVDWAHKMREFVQMFDYMVFAGSIEYDRHLWTIPCEFRASLVLFLSHCFTARMRPAIRLLSYAVLIYWVFHWQRWEIALFFSGAIIAELNLMSAERDSAASSSNTLLAGAPSLESQTAAKPAQQRRRWRVFWPALFLASLYIASYPEADGANTPGYRTLARFIPAYFDDKMRFWPVLAAMLLVLSVSNSRPLKALFTLAPIQYLGKISFALYLMHGPVIHTFGYAIMEPIYSRSGIEPRWRLEMGFGVYLALVIPAVVWAADVFWRAVDIPAVKFARWVEARVVAREAFRAPGGFHI